MELYSETHSGINPAILGNMCPSRVKFGSPFLPLFRSKWGGRRSVTMPPFQRGLFVYIHSFMPFVSAHNRAVSPVLCHCTGRIDRSITVGRGWWRPRRTTVTQKDTLLAFRVRLRKPQAAASDPIIRGSRQCWLKASF